jgi:serine/threonine protein kinase
MSSASQLDASRDFLEVARELDLLTAEIAASLSAESTARGQSPRDLAQEKGLLTAIELEIIETLRAPQRAVPGYVMLGLIGYGGMGVVYRARQLALDRTVALKTILVRQIADATAIKRFEQEATLAARLAHPNIITAYDFGRHEGRLFFAMELVEGEDAERLVRRAGPLDEVLAWSLVRQTAAGLAHARQLGIVHRDIKPANLLLVKPPAGFPLPAGVPLVKIADFGLARLTQDDAESTRLTTGSAALGSPLYMAPEQLQAGQIDHRVDLYALGATAYQLLAGHAPLAGRTMAQVMSAKLAGAIPDLRSLAAGVSAESARLVRTLLEVEPDKRPADYEQLIAQVDTLIANVGQKFQQDAWAGPPSQIAVSAAPTMAVQGSTTKEVSPATRTDRRWMIWTVVAAALIPVARQLLGPRDPGRRDLVPSGRRADLFNGREIDQWVIEAGGWHPGRNDDNATVLQGAGVVLRRMALTDAAGKTIPLEFYRLTIFVQLHEAKSAEVHFEFPQPSPNVVRLTPEGCQLGRRMGGRGEFSPLGPFLPYTIAVDQQRVVQIERHTGGWWVLVDEQLAGAVAARVSEPLAQFRLTADKPAWFSDVVVEELIAPKQ